MTTSRITTGLPIAINRRTKPVKGHAAALDRLRTELRAYREGEEQAGKVAVLIVVRDPRGDTDARVKAILDAGEGVLYETDKQVGPVHIEPKDDDGPPVEVACFAWPAERCYYLAAIEAASNDVCASRIGTGRAGMWPDRCGGP